MASIRVRAVDFSSGALPEVCARSGELAKQRYRLVAPGPSGRVAGMIPLSQITAKSISLQRRAFVAAAVLSALGVILGTFTNNAMILATSLVVGIGGVAGLLRLLFTFVSAQLSDDGQWVTLQRVHEKFVQAVKTPPSKCDGCTGSSTCSIAEMDACDGVGAAH